MPCRLKICIFKLFFIINALYQKVCFMGQKIPAGKPVPVMNCGSNGNTENPKDYREKENAPTRKKKEEKRTLL